MVCLGYPSYRFIEVSCHAHLSAPLGASGRLLSTGNRSLRGQLLHVTGAVPIGKWLPQQAVALMAQPRRHGCSETVSDPR